MLKLSPVQTQGRCAENYLVSGAACSPASNQCSQGHYLKKGHGIMTGTVQYSTVQYSTVQNHYPTTSRGGTA